MLALVDATTIAEAEEIVFAPEEQVIRGGSGSPLIGDKRSTTGIQEQQGDLKRSKSRPVIEREADPARLALRQKQIDYGKNTRGYDQYTLLKPRYSVCESVDGSCSFLPYRRSMRVREDPWTPDKTRKYSRRAWDGLIRAWRRKLHKFDPDDSSSASFVIVEE